MPYTRHAGMFIGTPEDDNRRRKKLPASIHITDHLTDQILATLENKPGAALFWNDTHRQTTKNEETFDFTMQADLKSPVKVMRQVADSAESVESMKVASWNIHGGRNQNGDYIDLTAGSKTLLDNGNYDVVGLQELRVNYSGSHPNSKNPIAAFGYPFGRFYKSTSLPEEPTADYGIGVLNQYQMSNHVQYTLPNSVGAEVRILSQAEMWRGRKKIYIFNAHLRWDNDSIRLQQMKFIKNKLDSLQGASFILFGDFNVRSASEFDLFLPDYQFVNGHNGTYYDTYNLTDWPTKRIDNIICSRDLTIKNQGMTATTLSDHSILFAELEWTESHEVLVSRDESISGPSEAASKRNRVIIPDEDGFYREFIIQETYQAGRTKEVRCIGSFTEIAKQKVIEPVSRVGDTAYTALDWALTDTAWQPGIVEYSGIRQVDIEEVMTGLGLIYKLASIFELEVRFRVEIKANKIVGRYVDLIKKQGQYRGKEIVLGKDLVGVKRKETQDICTALLVLGPTRTDGTRLMVRVYDSDALVRWGRNGRHLWGVYEPETDNEDITEERLTQLGEAELAKRVNTYVQYEADTVAIEHVFGYEHEKVRLGDTSRIKDTSFQPTLYLEARVISVERSVSDSTRKNFLLGDYIEYREEDLKKAYTALQSRIAKKASVEYTNTEILRVYNDVETGEVPLPAEALNGTIGVDLENPIVVTGTDSEEVGSVQPGKTGFAELYVGNLDSPNAVGTTTQPIELYVAATAVNAGYEPSDSNSGADWNNALLTINEAIRRIPKYVNHDVTIWLAYNQDFPKGFSLYGFQGSGTISIKTTGLTKVREFAYVYNNTCNIYLEKIHFYTTSSYVAIHNQASSNLYVWGCRFYGLPNNGTDYGVRTTDGGFTKIISCEFYSVQVGVMVYHGGRTYVYNNTGNCAQNAFYASGGTIMGGGTAPTAPAIVKSDLGGEVNGFTNPTGTGGANNVAPDAPYTTATWNSTGGNNWSTSGWWGNDGVKQGNYGYGRRTGLWFFGTGPAAAQGKTIKSMRVWIQRAGKGGSSAKVPITVRWHTYSSQPSSPGDLDLSAESASINLGYNEGAWVNLPSSFFPYFQSGTAKGIGVYSGDSNYAILTSSSTLEITYQ